LFGKEMPFGKPSKNRTFSVNGRVSIIGGNRYTAIDLEASKLAETEVRDVANTCATRGDDIFLANLAVSFRRDRPKSTHELKFDIQNATNAQGHVSRRYNSETEEIEFSDQLPLLPVISYRIKF
jgi:hypothetical protein